MKTAPSFIMMCHAKSRAASPHGGRVSPAGRSVTGEKKSMFGPLRVTILLLPALVVWLLSASYSIDTFRWNNHSIDKLPATRLLVPKIQSSCAVRIRAGALNATPVVDMVAPSSSLHQFKHRLSTCPIRRWWGISLEANQLLEVISCLKSSC